MQRIYIKCLSILILIVVGSTGLQAFQSVSVDLKAYKRIDKPARDEVSGIVRVPGKENHFWVHGDSGTKNRVYLINKEGEVLKPKKGVELKGRENIDWEDIAITNSGELIVADIGNNCSCRTDQALLFLTTELGDKDEIESDSRSIVYPEPDGFVYKFIDFNPDAEAIFWHEGEVYIFTKHIFGRNTKVFKTQYQEGVQDTLALVTEVDFDNKVTAADLAFNKLAVLTYSSLWVFQLEEGRGLFEGPVRHYTFKAEQVESVGFLDEHTVIIAEENGDLYQLNLKQ